MGDISIHQIATIYIWFGLGALFYLMALIARFYEQLSGERTYYSLFAIPAISFAIATILMTRQDVVAGDVAADIFFAGERRGTRHALPPCVPSDDKRTVTTCSQPAT